jgi:chromosome segregation ATPase
MFGDILLSNSFVVMALVAGFVAGAVLSRLLGGVANRPVGKRADDLHHRIRALDADLRVAQRRADELKGERDALNGELVAARAEIGTLREQASAHDDMVRKLKANIRHECEKTSQLRLELAERAEEMVRTHVQLREAKTELGVTQAGASVDTDQIARLERERDEMGTKLESLRKQMAALGRGPNQKASTVTLDGDDDLLVDC